MTEYSEKEIIEDVLSSGINLAIEKSSRNYDRYNSSKINEVYTSTF